MQLLAVLCTSQHCKGRGQARLSPGPGVIHSTSLLLQVSGGGEGGKCSH